MDIQILITTFTIIMDRRIFRKKISEVERKRIDAFFSSHYGTQTLCAKTIDGTIHDIKNLRKEGKARPDIIKDVYKFIEDYEKKN